MSSIVGPNVNNSSAIFYIDGNNPKSFPLNNSVQDLISETSVQTGASLQSGVLVSDSSLTEFSKTLSSENILCVSVAIENPELKDGAVFSICSDSLVDNTTETISVDAHTVFTTQATSVHINETYNAAQSQPDAHSVFTTQSTTVNISGGYSPSNISQPDAHTVFTTQASSVHINETYNSSIMSQPDAHNLFTTQANKISSVGYQPNNEISFGFKDKYLDIRYRSGDINNSLLFPATINEQDVFTIIYRKLSAELNIRPVTVFQNNTLIIDTNTKLGNTIFSDDGISLFNRKQENFAEYGIQSIRINTTEPTLLDIENNNNILRK